ncbi:hypothetical protein HAX54_050990 [Datura stramonium]|uniref:Gamma-glutamylcyclotransferase family protein n=1 Tax=Datura stramonium TaxID=4076 RepID=A0ABS8RHE9_DATST|nr:hypothetical protein [Datura stramonium]
MAITEEATKTDSRLIFTYGTLKRGFPNHRLMENLIGRGDVVFVGKVHHGGDLPALACRPYGIPYLINICGSGHRGPKGHYERLPVTVTSDGGEMVAAEAYFAHRSFGEGMWKKCGEVGLEEFSMELSRKYERKEDRPSNHDFSSRYQILSPMAIEIVLFFSCLY